MQGVVGAVLAVAFAMAPVIPATPWERYLSHPTGENADAVQAIAYSGESAPHNRMFRDLDLLAIQVWSSDLEAVRLAYRLRAGADGHLGETLDIMLGRLIRINPRLFLTTLRQQGSDIVRLDSLVGNFGEEYLDREEATHYEAERRRAALMSVADADLVTVRDRCVLELKVIER